MNVNVSTNTSQGSKESMEDCIDVRFVERAGKTFTYLAVFDGHGGENAALYAKSHLFSDITSQEGFFSESDDDIVSAIKQGFRLTHNNMKTVIGK